MSNAYLDFLFTIPSDQRATYKQFKTLAKLVNEPGEGQMRRFFVERAEFGDALEQMLTHARASNDSCPCYICENRPRRGFTISGALLFKALRDYESAG
jgi:hypothetical protein